jgi:hypothetical protein
MNIFECNTKEDLKTKLDDVDKFLEEEDRNYNRRKWLGWITSASCHVLLLLIFMTVVYVSVEEKIDNPPVKIVLIPQPIQDNKINEKKIIQLIENTVITEVDEVVTDKIADIAISNIELPDDIPSTEDLISETDGQKGRTEAISSIEEGGTGIFQIIGSGGPPSGMYGNRTKSGKKKASKQLGPYGASTLSAVDLGLRWLNKHQSVDGSWNAINYYLNCVDGLKCEPGGGGSGDVNVAMTGYSLLCYLGVGYDHKTVNKYRKQVANGINYLIRIQKPDGSLGDRNYEHAVAAMALFEAYGMTNDISLVDPCKKALKVLLDRQASSVNKESSYKNGLGWDYVAANSSRTDFSVSGWCVMSLKSAYSSGFDVKNSMKDFDLHIKSTWEASNPNWNNITPYDKTVFPYSIDPSNLKVSGSHLSFIGGLCSVFLGHKSGDIMLDTLTNDVKSRWLDNKAYRSNLYALYYSSLLSFQTQTTWKDWRNEYVPYLIDNQLKTENCYNGTWKFDGQSFHGSDTSQVLKHTYALLALEVAYRYAIVSNIKPR